MNVPVALQRLWIQVTADRRRFGLFCATLVVGLLLWARLIVITNTPRTVVADDNAEQAAQPVQTPASASLSGTVANSLSEREKAPLRVVLATSPQRDPFVISPEHFPRRSNGPLLVKDESKFQGDHAEDSLQVRYAAMAGRLKLEAILSPGGGKPLVVINARTYQLNDEIPVPNQRPGEEQVRFRLVHVGERSAILEYDGHHFERTLRGVDDE